MIRNNFSAMSWFGKFILFHLSSIFFYFFVLPSDLITSQEHTEINN